MVSSGRVHPNGVVQCCLWKISINLCACAWTIAHSMRWRSRISIPCHGLISCSINCQRQSVLQDRFEVRVSPNQDQPARYTKDYFFYRIWVVWVSCHVLRIGKCPWILYVSDELSLYAKVRQVCCGVHRWHSGLFREWARLCWASKSRADMTARTSVICEVQQVWVLA